MEESPRKFDYSQLFEEVFSEDLSGFASTTSEEDWPPAPEPEKPLGLTELSEQR